VGAGAGAAAAPWRVDRLLRLHGAWTGLLSKLSLHRSLGGRATVGEVQQHAYRVCSVEHQEAVAAEGEKRDRRQVNS
jgi:hypothetical protein